MVYSKELELLQPVSRYFAHRHYDLQHSELPFYEYRIDLYGYSEDSDTALAVELKLGKWQRALEQALLYQLCSDLIYIAMPLTAARRVDRQALAVHGIGLIAVGRTGLCRELLPAAMSPVTRPHYKYAYVQLLKESSA